MAINVSPIAGVDAGINDIRRRTADLINADVLPNEGKLWGSAQGRSVSDGERDQIRHQAAGLREEVKAKVRDAGLWAPHLPAEYGGMGLDFLQLAYM
jgi:acyl-CoA dehydrogenase